MRTAGRSGVALAAALTMAITTAACSSGDEARDTLPPPTDAPPGATGEPTPTTPVSLPGSSTTVTSTSTTSTTSSTSNTSTTSTTSTSVVTTRPPASTEAAAVLIGGAGGTAWLPIGWWDGAAWVEAGGDAATEVPVAPGDLAQIVTSTGSIGGAAVGDLVEGCQDGQVGFELAASVDEADPPGFGYSAVAVNAPWEVQPRPVVEAGLQVDEYRAIGARLADELGADGSLGSVSQVARVDLDGDGTEEVAVVFEHVQESLIGAVGDYSLVYGRLPSPDGSVRDQLLDAAHVTADMDDFPVIDRFRVLGAADLNGDGTMELLVRDWYYEGAGVLAYELVGGSLARVLRGGCGS